MGSKDFHVEVCSAPSSPRHLGVVPWDCPWLLLVHQPQGSQRWEKGRPRGTQALAMGNRSLYSPFSHCPRALSMDILPCPPSNSDAGKSWPAGTPTWGSRNSYLAVQVDIDQSDVAIEIDVLCDGSIVRGRDQESLWGQEWARACHPLAGAHGPPVHSPQPL